MRKCGNLNQIKAEIGGLVPESKTRHREFQDFQVSWVNLLKAVNQLIDNSGNQAGKLDQDGIKQKLEKKDGLFR